MEYSGPRKTNSAALNSCRGVLSRGHTHTPNTELLFKDEGEDCTRPMDLVENMRIALELGSNQFYISSSTKTSGHKFAQWRMKKVQAFSCWCDSGNMASIAV